MSGNEHKGDGPGTRYSHTSESGGSQDQGERKDDGWRSRQGSRQSHPEGRGNEGEPQARASRPSPPMGTNTQGDLPGIENASREVAERLEEQREPSSGDDGNAPTKGAGTDQPRRMGGPLGPDPDHPRLPEGAQDSETRGTGAGGFDRGVDAKRIGAVHQGVRVEDEPGS